ncbi:isocitrate lyase 1 [Tulasnella sp. 417]|nr:isocitrate lyase 1 [Tulasnella sp. 417]
MPSPRNFPRTKQHPSSIDEVYRSSRAITEAIAAEKYGPKRSDLSYWTWDVGRTREGSYRYQGALSIVTRDVDEADQFQLRGLQSNGYISDLFAQNFAKDDMLAYVSLIQRKERELGTDVFTHQKWSGAECVDHLLMAVTGGVSSTAAMGKCVTETQLGGHSK